MNISALAREVANNSIAAAARRITDAATTNEDGTHGRKHVVRPSKNHKHSGLRSATIVRVQASTIPVIHGGRTNNSACYSIDGKETATH